VRILLAAVGRPRDPSLAPAIREYESRIARYFKLETVEVRDAPAGRDDARAREEESAALLSAIPEGFEVVTLDPAGEAWSSEELARFLGDLALYGRPGAAFVIGGPRGLAGSLLERASRRWALSRLTLPHELARLVVAEQLYRAGTILRGEPYHR
jgi:23S rRNA (pseudouridine1915-N3)-methyltransferase